MEPAGAGGSVIRANLRVGGGTLARHQLALALALGCERIICLARGIDSDVVALQHVAEAGGARFHVVNGPRGLMGLVTNIDEVIGMTEGLMAAHGDVASVLEHGQGVFVQPVETGLAAGFERIDTRHAAAGIMRLPARLVERLADLPADCDALSALQRIALQAGLAQRELPGGLIESGRWLLVRDEIEAHAAEKQWIRLHTGPAEANTPTSMIARSVVRAFGPTLLHANSGSSALAIGSAALVLLAFGAAWFGFSSLAFGFAAVGWIVRKTGGLLARVEDNALLHARSLLTNETVFEWLLDLLLIAIMVMNWPDVGAVSPFYRAFPPIMLLALVRLTPRLIRRDWSAWLGDRLLLALVLIAASLAGYLPQAAQLLALLLALAGIALPEGPDNAPQRE
jgi:hypothetical protein